MFEVYSMIAKQIGRVADDLMDNSLEYEWARYSLIVINEGVDDEELSSLIKTFASDFELRGDRLALKLYDISSNFYAKAKNSL
ncbi:hypothetical protein [Raoultella sp. YJ]|uniref:hypothetical protein n=1 Tax=Raoultella sp. YJ TaxID=1850565 RepID=UPI000A190B0D|nr:hypothetical protein [Raoultella sp. YJ]